MSDMNEVAAEWLAARAVVAQFLRELPGLYAPSDAVLEQRASALLARLASADPPLLVCTGRACSAREGELTRELDELRSEAESLRFRLDGGGHAIAALCETRDELARQRDEALAALAAAQKVTEGLAARVASQSDVLSKAAEKRS